MEIKESIVVHLSSASNSSYLQTANTVVYLSRGTYIGTYAEGKK